MDSRLTALQSRVLETLRGLGWTVGLAPDLLAFRDALVARLRA